jgi:preprotein translocase subunit SecG
MEQERISKLRSEVTVLLLWLGVAVAYLGWIAVVLLVMLQLASGYGSSFFGTGEPPNTEEFRRAVGLWAFLAYVTSTAGAALALWRGDRAMRWAAAVPAVLSVLALVCRVIGRLG